jgi:membrane fusion protein, multidrug efflux system
MVLMKTHRFGHGYSRFLIAMAAVVACKGAPPAKGNPPTPVRVAPVSRIDAPVVVRASGVVEPMQTVAVTAQTTASLLQVLFHEGDFVQRGQTLFRLDPRPLQAAVDQAKATLARDEAQAAAAKHDDERYAKLADMGYVSRSQADQMHATAVAQAATSAADRAALRSAQVSLGFTTIRAPIAGRTGSVLVRAGNNVSPGGGPLVVINQLSPVLVRFPVLEQDFAPLQSAVHAHPLVVQAASSDSAQIHETGRLTFLDNAVDSLTGTVTGKADFPNTGHTLWPGELVFLTVQLDVQRGVLAVPNEAVLAGPQGSYVYVVSDKNTAVNRQIVTGLQVGDMTVVQHGLTGTERVIVDGQSRVNPNGRVAILTGAPGGDSGVAGHLGEVGSAAGDVTAGRAGAPGSAATPADNQGAQTGAAPPIPSVANPNPFGNAAQTNGSASGSARNGSTGTGNTGNAVTGNGVTGNPAGVNGATGNPAGTVNGTTGNPAMTAPGTAPRAASPVTPARPPVTPGRPPTSASTPIRP